MQNAIIAALSFVLVALIGALAYLTFQLKNTQYDLSLCQGTVSMCEADLNASRMANAIDNDVRESTDNVRGYFDSLPFGDLNATPLEYR